MNTPTPPPNEEEHNPDGLTPEQYGAPAYRLLRPDEKVEDGDDYWAGREWQEAGWRKLPKDCTYRRRVSPAPSEPANSVKTDGQGVGGNHLRIAELEARCRELGQQLAACEKAAQEDKADLDWIENEAGKLWLFGNQFAVSFNAMAMKPFTKRPTVREAIRAARHTQESITTHQTEEASK